VNVGAHPLNVLSICTGGGGLDLGLELAIPCARPVCLVEREAFAVAHLVEAMCAGLLADCPVWTDARTFDGRPWRGVVDCLIGGIPCQPHSLAGRKQGSLDERDLWGPTRRIIVQTRPWVVLIENVAGMLSAGADDISGAERVLRDLRRLGYEVEAGIFSAAEVGAPHQRERLFILAVADPGRSEWRARDEGLFADRHQTGRDEGTGGAQQSGPHVAAASSAGLEGRERRGAFESVNREPTPRPVAARWSGAPMENAARSDRSIHTGRRAEGRGETEFGGGGIGLFPPGPGELSGWRECLAGAPELEPAFRRVADGLASRLDVGRVDRLRMLGNGVVPLAAAHAIRSLVHALAHRSAGATQLVHMMEAALPIAAE
jgi:DNA (cytosine-5)-methyltransferase 1